MVELSTVKTLAMFPGQGSQHVGMGKDVLDLFPDTKMVFEEAEDATGVSLRKLCLDGPESELTKTANQQPCILTVTAAMWSVVRSETDFRPDFFAGHSLGEYSALVAADKLSLATAASLVRHRGQAMQEAVPQGKGAMAAVMSFPADDLEKLCKDVSAASGESVQIVNFNSPQQLIISGHKGPVETVVAQLSDPEAKVKARCTMLPVSAPFHSKLMVPARTAMTDRLRAAELVANDCRVIPNLTGEVPATGDAYTIDNLIQQIDSPVLWSQTLNNAHNAGVRRFAEVGPGRVLFGLARRSLPKDSQLLHSADLKKLIADLS